jgi:hypothetical protein
MMKEKNSISIAVSSILYWFNLAKNTEKAFFV